MRLAEPTVYRKSSTTLFMHNMEAKWVEAKAGIACDGLGIVALVPYPEAKVLCPFPTYPSEPGNYYMLIPSLGASLYP